MRVDGWQRRLWQMVAGALVVPVLLMSLFATQVMPVRAADGSAMLVLCTGDGPVELAIDPATGAPVDPSAPADHDDPGHCGWAAATHVAALTAPTGLPPRPLRLIEPQPNAAAPSHLAAAGATGLPPSTGPPALI